VFTELLPSNEHLLWLHYSGLQVSCHSIYTIYAMHTYIKESINISSAYQPNNNLPQTFIYKKSRVGFKGDQPG
jgi:hypothetical protein